MNTPKKITIASNIEMTTTNRTVPTATINYERYKPYLWGSPYIPIGDEADDLEKYILEDDKFTHYLITSEKGMGKTLLVYHLAFKHEIPIIMLSCSSATKEGDLLGKTQLDNAGSYFQLGILPTAVELANHFGKCILYLDELNALDEQMQKILNSLLDERRCVVANGYEYRVNDNCKLQAIATTNPLGLGTNTIIEDLKSRFPYGREWLYNSKHFEVFEWTMPDNMKQLVMRFAEDLRSLRIKDSLSYSLSTRDLKAMNTAYAMLSKMNKGTAQSQSFPTHTPINIMKTVLKTCVINHKFDTSEERDAVRQLAYDVFGIDKDKL